MAGGYIYWANSNGSTIGRARVKGTDIDNNFVNAGSGSDPCGVVVYGPRLYWASSDSQSIGVANLNGTGVKPTFIVNGLNGPCGIAVG